MQMKNKFSLLTAIAFFSISVEVCCYAAPREIFSETKLIESAQKRKRKDWVRIKVTDIPAPLKITLAKREYSGWENGKMFRSRSTNIYLFEISESGQRRIFKFKPDGDEVHEE